MYVGCISKCMNDNNAGFTLEQHLSTVRDFPREGIAFLDISPLLAEPQAFKRTITELNERTQDLNYTSIGAYDAWADPVGQTVRFDTTTYAVAGVVEDFHYDDFFDPIMPVILTVAKEAQYNFLTVRVRPGAAAQTADAISRATDMAGKPMFSTGSLVRHKQPVSYELTHHDDGSADDHLVIGRVVGIYIDDRFIEDGRVNTAALRPIARLGYSEYAVVTEVFRMRRPD